MDDRFSASLEGDLREVESGAYLEEPSKAGGIDDDWEDGGGGSGMELALAGGSIPGTTVAGSSDEFREESSGFAIRRPPSDWERLKSPSMMGGRTPWTGDEEERRGGRGRERGRERRRTDWIIESGPEGGERDGEGERDSTSVTDRVEREKRRRRREE